MYFTYLLGLFLLAGVDGNSSIVRISQINEKFDFPGARDEKFHQIWTDLALDSRQLDDLEKTLNVLYKKYFGSPKVKLSLRSNDDGKSSLKRTISLIGEKICTHMKNVFKKFGVNISSRATSLKSKFNDTLSLKAAVYYNLMKIPLELNSIWQGIAAKMRKQLKKNNYANLGYKTSTFSLKNNEDNSERDLKISKTLKAIKNYSSHLYVCLEQRENSSFDVKRAFGKLTNHRPEETGKILKIRLEKPLSKLSNIRKDEYDQIHALICHGISENSRGDYKNCLREVKRIDKCTRSANSSQDGADDYAGEFPGSFYRTIKALDESCRKIPGKRGFSVECGGQKKMANSDNFSYITDFFMGDLKKLPALKNVADELGKTLTRSEFGAETLHEMATLVGIYEKGIERKEKLMKMAEQDGPQKIQYIKMARNISDYERHLVEIYFGTINDVGGTTTNVEKMLFDTYLVEQELSHPESLKCLAELIASIYADWNNNHPIFPPRPSEIHRPDNNSSDFELRYELPGSNGLIGAPSLAGSMKSSHDKPLKKFIQSLKRLGQNSPPRRTSSLVSLANTFLLATMFYECLAVLAAAIYRDDSASLSQNNSMENEYNDPWHSRNRRSPFFIDHQNQIRQMEDESNPLSITIETLQISPTLHNEEIPQNGGNFYDLKMAETIYSKKLKSTKKRKLFIEHEKIMY